MRYFTIKVVLNLIFIQLISVNLGSLSYGVDNFKKVLKVRSDLWCPYACDDKSTSPGIVIELAKKILEPQGYILDYKLVNWSRAVEEAKSGKIDALAGAAINDAPELIFPKKHQATVKYSFFSLKESTVVYKNHETFKDHGLGVISSYSYDEKTNELMKKKLPWIFSITGNDGLTQLVKMLKAKRIEAFIENPAVFYNFLLKNNINRDDFKVSGSPKMQPQKIYIGFSPKNKESRKLAKIMSQGMEKLVKDGTYSALLVKYNLQDL